MNEQQQTEPKDLKEVVKFAEKKFNQIKPLGLNFSAEAEFCIQILQNSPFLMKVAQECPRSVVSSMNQAAAIGLSMNPAKKECYLLSRNVKMKQASGPDIWESRIYLEPSYMGLNNVAINSGSIEWVQANVVRKNDESFVDNGAGLRPTHIYDAFATNDERGPIVGSYCVAKAGEDFLVTIMNKEKLDSIRGRSETWKKSLKNGGTGAGTWLSDDEEMCKKAVMRNGFKTWPKTDKYARMEEAVHISNENEGFEPLITSPEIKENTASEKQYLDELIEKSDHVRMFCFMTSLEVGVQTNLRHSFEKGTKGKYAAIIDQLQEKGRNEVHDCKAVIQQAMTESDESAAKELLEELPQEAIDWITHNSDDEVGVYIRECLPA